MEISVKEKTDGGQVRIYWAVTNEWRQINEASSAAINHLAFSLGVRSGAVFCSGGFRLQRGMRTALSQACECVYPRLAQYDSDQ